MSKKREERKKKRLEQEKKEKVKKFSRVFYLDKKVGQTPLEVLEKFQKTNRFERWKKEAEEICLQRKYKKKGCEKIPLAYAGRLDPMAHGKMLILAGEACKEREKFLGLDKEYIFEVLLGFESDSKDILGIVKADQNYTSIPWNRGIKKVEDNIEEILKKISGKRKMEYPIFSSKAVDGKPLFLWALEDRINEIEIPVKDVEIYDIERIQMKLLSVRKMQNEIFSKVESLKKVQLKSKELGEDFRRKKVLDSWHKSLRQVDPKANLIIIKLKVVSSSGTYMRNLAAEIGKELGTVGLAYSIKRTKIGKQKKFLGVRYWKNIL